MPYLDEEEEQGGQKMTPKQALLAWCKSKMPESIPMDNFNKDWNDGRAVACLVDAVAPGLFPECEDLDPKDKLENAKQAMQAAEDWLGVPQVKNFFETHKMLLSAYIYLIQTFYSAVDKNWWRSTGGWLSQELYIIVELNM